ncbi:helix-turn-helix domain-containing protein [Kitasatospora sp. NPDC059463]|uniref:nSTAND1 domain-containing NTPase n=1 Tax=unclassified Kitasatospora TaxID=2633591 RepID=UPI0036C1A48F
MGQHTGQEPPGTQEFGTELRRLRQERGLSLTALSRLVHYSKGYLSKIENGGKPATADLAQRCDDVLRADGALLRLLEPADSDDPGTAEGDGGPCPYPGSEAFGPHQARWFAGRDGTAAALLERLAERAGHGPLALVGASGTGKSSLLMAGLVPALRAGALRPDDGPPWRVVVCTPTAHPIAALRTALRTAPPPTGPHGAAGGPPAEGGLALIVDQFEETFTRCTDARERRAFVRVLHALATARPAALVVLGLRADFGERCLTQPGLAPVTGHGLFPLGAMTAAEVRECITRPAAEAGLRVEPGLVELLLRDLGTDEGTGGGTDRDIDLDAGLDTGLDTAEAPIGAPGTLPPLPLLSQALLATWRKRTGRTLTVDGYLRTGGIRGAITANAERVYTGLAPGDRERARLLLLRLVQVGPEGAGSRRPVPHEELPDPRRDTPVASGGPGAGRVLDAFVRARVLTVDRDGVAIAHDALLRAWPRLRGWVHDDRAGLLIHHRLAEAAADWERERRDPAALYRGSRLATARQWARDPVRRAGLTGSQDAFLRAGLEHEERRRREARRRARRERGLLAAVAGLLVVALTAAVLARQQRTAALEQGRAAASRAMAVESARLAAGRPEASMLLADRAFALAPTAEARGALLSTQAQPFAGRLTGHTGPVNSCAIDPDARLLATASTDGTVRLWSLPDRRPVATLTGHNSPVRAVAFSPDGRLLASAGSDGTVRLWDVAQRRSPVVLRGHVGPVRAVAFGADGRTVVSGGADGTVRVWSVVGWDAPPATDRGGADDPRTDRTADRTADSKADRTTGRPTDRTAFRAGSRPSRADPTAAPSSSGPGLAPEEPPAERRLLVTLDGHDGEVLAVATGPDGRTAASAGADHTVRLWDTATGTATATLTGHRGQVLGLALSPDGRTLASAGADRTVRLWDLATRSGTGTLTGHDDDVNALAFAEDGATLATAGGDGTVRLWDVAGRRVTATLGGHTDYVQGVAAGRDGTLLATAGFDRSAVLWDLGAATLTPHPYAEIWRAVFSPDGRTVATAGADGAVRLWDVATRGETAALTGHGSQVLGVAFSPDGRLLATAGADATVRLWDLATLSERARFTGHQGSVFAVAFSPDGQLLASAGEDRTARLWNVGRLGPEGVLIGHQDFVNSVAFAPDGRTLATGSDDLTVRLWDVADRRPTATLAGHTGAVRTVAFSPDGRTLASGGNDATVRTWDTAGRRAPAVLTGHTGAVRTVAFSPDGRTLAGAGNDGTIRLWDAARGTPTATLTGHGNAVWSVAFSPDGRTLAGGGSDGTVRLWRPDPAERSAAICALLGPVDRDRWAQLLPGQPFRKGCGAG